MAGADDIAGLLRFRDQIKKELQALAKRPASNTAFSLDPSSLKPVAKKIGEGVAASTPAELAAREANVATVRNTIAMKNRAPQEKYKAPPTSSSEVGWFAHEYTDLARPFKQWTHAKSDVAGYGEDYAKAFRAGPFDKTQPVAR